MRNYKPGDKVRYLCQERHERAPEYYPKPGTVGTVRQFYPLENELYVQWPNESTSWSNLWFCNIEDVEPVTEGGAAAC